MNRITFEGLCVDLNDLARAKGVDCQIREVFQITSRTKSIEQNSFNAAQTPQNEL